MGKLKMRGGVGEGRGRTGEEERDGGMRKRGNEGQSWWEGKRGRGKEGSLRAI